MAVNLKKLVVAGVLAGIVVALAARLVLVGAFAAKILNHSEYLNSWKGAVSRRTETISGIEADIYGPDSRFPVIMVHGVTPTGKNNLDLVRVSESIAQVGFQVVTPDFKRLRRQTVSSRDADDVRAVVAALNSDVGLVCVSYGCGPALIAAASDAIRDRVRFVVTFAGYFDMASQLRYIVTMPENPIGYDKWVYARANAETVGDNLEPYWDMFRATTGEEFDQRFAALPPELSARIEGISPSHSVSRLRAHLIIVHGDNDPSIPLSQSLQLDAAAATLGIPHDLFVFHMYGHTQPKWPALSWNSLKSTYGPEGFKMLRLANLMLSQR